MHGFRPNEFEEVGARVGSQGQVVQKRTSLGLTFRASSFTDNGRKSTHTHF